MGSNSGSGRSDPRVRMWSSTLREVRNCTCSSGKVLYSQILSIVKVYVQIKMRGVVGEVGIVSNVSAVDHSSDKLVMLVP